MARLGRTQRSLLRASALVLLVFATPLHAQSVRLLSVPACPDRVALSKALSPLDVDVGPRGARRIRVRVRELRSGRYLVALAGARRARRHISATGDCAERALIVALAIERMVSPLFAPRRGVRARPRVPARATPRPPPLRNWSSLAPPGANYVLHPAPVPLTDISSGHFVAPHSSPLSPAELPFPASLMLNAQLPPLGPAPSATPRTSPPTNPLWSVRLGVVTQTASSSALAPGVELATQRTLDARWSLEGRVSWRPFSEATPSWRVRVDDWRLGVGLSWRWWRGLRAEAALMARLRVLRTEGNLTSPGATSFSGFASAGLSYAWRFGAFGVEVAARGLTFEQTAHDAH